MTRRKIICKNCNKKIQSYSKKFCSTGCYHTYRMGKSTSLKGKKYEDIYGIKEAKIKKQKIRDAGCGFKNGHKFFGDVKTWFKKGHISWSKKNKGKYHLWKNKKNPMTGKISVNKNKTLEELYGIIKAKEMRENNKQKHLGKTHIFPLSKKIKLSKLRKKQWQDKTSNYHSIERSKKIKKARAKQQNVYTTSIEIKIQNFLKQLGIEFFTHKYMKEIEHSYQCDILIPSMNLVIECDGDYWHKYPIGNDIDHIRTSELIQKGFKVLRLWEFEIKAMDINKFRRILN